MEGYIKQLESFGSVDGPGVRFIIFFSGCPLRCKYCHNPDMWDMQNGKKYTAEQLLDEAESCRPFWGKNGGITASGGEPLFQIDFLVELFEKAKARGITTCIDTSGAPYTEDEPWFSKFERLMTVTDTVLLDIKHIDENEHISLTGKSGKNVQMLFKYLDKINKPVWIRHVLVPGITDNDEYLTRTRDFIRTLHNIHRVEILPYHGLGSIKYKDLGMDYVLKDVESPSQERVENARKILECEKYNAWKE